MMRTVLKTAFVAVATLAFSGYQLPPHKDELYDYPKVLEAKRPGLDEVIDYQSGRDILRRDRIHGKVVKRRYVTTVLPWKRKSRKYAGAYGRKHSMYVVGKPASARIAVVFLHGRNGTHRLGVKDEVFGGNFNRLQNLMLKGRGVYYTPTFEDFGAEGAADLKQLIRRIEAEAPNASLIFACGSTGANLCWRLARDDYAKRRIDGMVLLGGTWEDSVVGAADFPIVFGHGGKDKLYPVGRMRTFANALRRGGQNVRFVEFATGGHGTPIRMLDWRKELNWLLAQK